MKRGTKVSIKRCFLLILSAVFLALNVASIVSAASGKIILTGATIEEQSATATVETPTIDSNKVTSGITFEKADDYAIIDLEIKNNDTLDYSVDSISDNNQNEYLETSYTYDPEIKTSQTAHIHLKLKYKKQLINSEKINVNDLTLTVKLTRADATPSEVIINPSTVDKLPLYICTLAVLIALLIIFRKQIPTKLKICAIVLVAISVVLPVATYATESYEYNIVFANIEMRGEFEYFDITFASGADNTVVTKKIRYGSPVGSQLPTAIDKFGYEFVNWTDENGEIVTAETIITAPRSVKANYKLIIMTVNFDANTGEGDMASQVYNLNTAQNLTANTFTKNKYNFIEWNTSPDGQGNTYADGQSIEFSEAGEITLYAQWRSNPATVTAGTIFNAKLKHLAGDTYADWTSDGNTTIQAVKKADALPDDFDYSNPDGVVEASNSDFPIYAWYDGDEKTIYLYTPADWIKTGTSLQGLFRGMTKLTDISGVSEWDTSSATYLNDAFDKTAIKNTDAIATTDRGWYSSWDVSNVTNMQGTFDQARSLTDISALATWDTSKLNSARYLFSNANRLADITPLAEWNVSNVSDMSYMFVGTKITNVDALATTQRDGYKSWDVSNVTNMACMFDVNTSLTNLDGIANWNTSKVSSIAYIFNGAANLTDISALANWNTSKLSVIDYAFHKTGISNIDALADWNMSKLTSMYNAFSENANLTNISGAENWDLSNVQNMNQAFMGSAIMDISGAAKWNVSKVAKFRQAFSNNNISSIEALRPTARNGYTSWDISAATDLSIMFAGNPISDISPIAEWNTSKVKDMSSMFSGTNVASVAPLTTTQRDGYKSWDVSKVTNFSYMFNKCALQDVNGISNWDTSNAKTLGGMFSLNAQLSDIAGLSLWNTSNVTSLLALLAGTAITNVDALATTQRDGYVSWDTANVTDMNSLFSGATKLTDISGVELWNTSKVTGIANMFKDTAITNVDALATTQRDGYVSWDTANVTEMGSIFNGASQLTDISGLAKWNTSKVTSMMRSFQKTGIISTVPLTPTDRGTYTSWDTGNVRDMFELFSGSRNVNDLSGLFNWDVHSVTDKRYMFSNIPASVQRPSWAQ